MRGSPFLSFISQVEKGLPPSRGSPFFQSFTITSPHMALAALTRSPGGQLQLQAPPAAADINGGQASHALVHHGGKLLLHAQGRTAAPNIARNSQQVLDVEHFQGISPPPPPRPFSGPAPGPPAARTHSVRRFSPRSPGSCTPERGPAPAGGPRPPRR